MNLHTQYAKNRFIEYGYITFKYIVYGALFLNIIFFALEEYRALPYLYPSGVSFTQFFIAFSTTLDTVAWVFLLLLFELETHQIPDEKLTPKIKNMFQLARWGAYIFIFYIFFGYLGAALELNDYQHLTQFTNCDQYAQYSLMLGKDNYQSLSLLQCQQLADVYFNPITLNLATIPIFVQEQKLLWLDVINAGAWILVVISIEYDVHSIDRERKYSRFNLGVKIILYVTLLFAAIYWGFYGDFIDFWDAFLWIVAFIFIEKNVISWRTELQQE